MITCNELSLLRWVMLCPTGGELLSVWRCLLVPEDVRSEKSAAELLDELHRLRTSAVSCVIILLRGGHFAASLFSLREAKGKGQQDPFIVLAHKTFHRYVVR